MPLAGGPLDSLGSRGSKWGYGAAAWPASALLRFVMGASRSTGRRTKPRAILSACNMACKVDLKIRNDTVQNPEVNYLLKQIW